MEEGRLRNIVCDVSDTASIQAYVSGHMQPADG